MTTYRREVSSADRSFIAGDALGPPTVIQLVLEGVGNPPSDRLREALDSTSQANPSSCIKLCESDSTLTWIVGPSPAFVEVHAPDMETFDEHHAALYDSTLPDARLNVRQGPTCALHVLRAKMATYLVFRALHAVMDGKGVIAWAMDFARCLRGEQPLGHDSTLTVDQFLKEMAAPRRAAPPADALHPFGPANTEPHQRQFRWRRITVNRKLSSLMSGQIAVALAKHARVQDPDGAFRLALPADLRHYRPGERITGNFLGGLHIDVPTDADAESVALRIVQALYTHESIKRVGIYAGDFVGSLAVLQVGMYFGLSHVDDTGRYRFSGSLSNLGTINRSDFSSTEFQLSSAYFVPLEGDIGCTITLNGCDEQTEITVGLASRFAGEGRFETFVDLVQRAVDPAKDIRTDAGPKLRSVSGVSETAVLTLRARAAEHDRADHLFADPLAKEWMERLLWPENLNRWWASLNDGRGMAIRADAIDHLVMQYHGMCSLHSVTEIGCGFSTRSNRLAHLEIPGWTSLDFASVIEMRQSLGATGSHIASSVLDFDWMDQLQIDPAHHLFVAEGLLYYLERHQVDALFAELRRRFTNAAILFDVVGANDFPVIYNQSMSAGVPIAWHLEGDFAEALSTFQLGLVADLSPNRVMQDATLRYWPRMTPAEQVAAYLVMNSAGLMRGRSGLALGRFE